MRKWIVGVLAIAMITSVFLSMGSASSAVETGIVTGEFPNRMIELTKSQGKTSLEISIPSERSGEWWSSLESTYKGVSVVVKVWSESNGVRTLVDSSTLRSLGAESTRITLAPGIDYFVTYTYSGKPWTAVLREHFLPSSPYLQPGTWSFPFSVTDAVFDPRRPYVYATDKFAKRLYFANILTGSIDKTFEFSLMPESVAITPDASKLYVSLLTREHDSYWWDENGHQGYIAEFDLASQTLYNTLFINEDPYDILGTSNGLIIVSGGSGQWTHIRAYAANDGAELGNYWNIRQMSHITLHPSEQFVYTADQDVSPSDIFRYDLSPDGTIGYAGDSPYHGDYWMGGNVWANPLGDSLVTRGGGVFSAGQPIGSDMVYITDLSSGIISDVSFDTIQKVIFTGAGTTLRYHNLLTYVSIGSWDAGGAISTVKAYEDVVAVLLPGNGLSQVVMIPHPVPNGATNTAPVAQFSITPEAGGTTATEFLFDASSSSDAQDPLSNLLFRWDFNSDGVWDTEFSSSTTLVKKFDLGGTYSVRLQTEDTLGLLGLAVRSLDVVFQPDSGTPGPAHPTFQIPGSVVDAVFDPIRPYVYVTDKYAKKVYFVNLDTGFVDRQFEFPWMTESLAITPDSSRLYVALLTREHDYSWFDESGHVGYIAGFDLSTQVKDTEFQINEDPFDLLATSDGQLVVSGGSGQWTQIRVYDAGSGAEKGNAGIRQLSKLALSPSEKIVYAADTDSSPSDVTRYDLSSSGAITQVGNSPYHGDHRFDGNVWVAPSGSCVVTRGGDVFTAGQKFSSDLIYITSMAPGPVDCLAFDLARSAIFTGEGTTLHYYNMADYTSIGSWPVTQNIAFLGIRNNIVFLVLSGEPGSTPVAAINGLLYPDRINAPPVARFTVTPESGGTVATEYVFEASSSSDAEDPLSSLQFMWDLDGDGTWDSDFSSSPVATMQYAFEGTYSVRLLVKDRLGLMIECVHVIYVAILSDPGTPGPVHPPSELPYVITDAVFDPDRPYVYVTDKLGKHVYFVNLSTMLTERQFDFDYMPESATLTPDGTRLFVALLTREHSDYWFDEDGHVGYIASFDLTLGVKDRQFKICEDPFDLVATSNGHLVVSGGSGQHTKIRVFNAIDGALLGTSYIYMQAKLALHLSEHIVYSASTLLWPSNVAHYDLSDAGVISVGRNSPYHGYHRFDGNVWVSPVGDVLFTRGGDVFTAGQSQGSDLLYVASMAAGPINSLAFDADGGRVITSEGTSINTYSLANYSLLTSVDCGLAFEYLDYRSYTDGLTYVLQAMYAIDVQESQSRIQAWLSYYIWGTPD